MLYMGYTFSKVYHHFWNGFTIVNLFDSGEFVIDESRQKSVINRFI